MTRDQAIERVGLVNVEAAEADNCELTNRVGGNGLMHDDPYLEFAGSAAVDYGVLSQDQTYNLPACGCRLVVYYRVTNEIEQRARDADCGVWDIADIAIDEYVIE